MLVLDGLAEVNESLLTGESDTIVKKNGAEILSGSFLTSGHLVAEVRHVGADNYAAKIINETKAAKPIKSELIQSIQKSQNLPALLFCRLESCFFLKPFSYVTALLILLLSLRLRLC